MWKAYFLAGWEKTGAVMAEFLGGAAAVLLMLLVLVAVLIILVAILDALFDKITSALARRWEKTGKHPAHRWAEIIAGGRKREE